VPTHLNGLFEFGEELLSLSNGLSSDELAGLLMDVAELRQNTVMKVRAGDRKQAIAGRKCRLTAADSLTPLTQLTQRPLQPANALYYGAVLLRRRPPSCVDPVRLSVCLSVCPVPPPRKKTKRPTNTKLGRKGPWDTSTPWTNFKIKGSEVKVTAANCVVGKKSP